jgi:oligoendopeptidase F
MDLKTQQLSLTWNLDSIFNKKGSGKEYTELLSTIRTHLIQLTSLLKNPSSLDQSISLAQTVSADLAEISSFVVCLLAEDTTNTRSLQLQGEAHTLQAELDTLLILMDEQLRALDSQAFKKLLKSPLCEGLAFPLEERKKLAETKLPYSLEALITKLSIDGYHGYSQLFYLLHGSLKFPIPNQDGKTEYLSTGQIENKLSDQNRETRVHAFSVYKKIFKEHEAHFAETLNHIAGFRLHMYEQRGWHDVLAEPLTSNRMQGKTLDAMWSTINSHIDPFVSYLKHKASLFGLSKLSWHDVDIPISNTRKTTSYPEASDLIVSQFARYSSNMARFSKEALQQGWIEAEDRKNKSAGGFCVGFPLKKESRIFMTYSGSQHNVATLAHELGHAYHNVVIFPHPYFAQNIKMNVAETASTMAEMIVADAALQQASSKDEKLRLLDDKISRSIVFFMNIQARFLFETSFYNARKKGYVLPEELCSLMENAQKQAFKNALGEWHPHFWASKMHFYMTEVPFYNFPYTFGYLLSLGVYALLKKDPASFESKYDALLYDTPLMTSEDLAKKHFNIDLTQKPFWELAMQEANKDVKTFFQLSS